MAAMHRITSDVRGNDLKMCLTSDGKLYKNVSYVSKFVFEGNRSLKARCLKFVTTVKQLFSQASTTFL